METTSGGERERLLDPVDRISEILFGLIMAVTIVGSLSIATAGATEARTVTLAALGCNLAWGLVDAVMYLVRTVTQRTRNLRLARRIGDVDPDAGRRLIVQALPGALAEITGPEEIEGMRRRLLTVKLEERAVLLPRDWLEAIGVFLLVVIATFPVVAPFMLTANIAQAMRWAQGITVGMLFLAGVGLGRYAGLDRPMRTGFVMAILGTLLIAAVKALGG